jgi:hypothetical protein
MLLSRRREHDIEAAEDRRRVGNGPATRFVDGSDVLGREELEHLGECCRSSTAPSDNV